MALDYIDIYCERVGPGLAAEPLNALTNAAFLLAAWAAWRSARRAGVLDGSLALLLALAVAIGIGSSLFHTFATTWARVTDELPILLFQLCFLWLYARRALGWRGIAAGLLVAAFLAAALYARQFSHVLNGSVVYAPAVALVCALGFAHYLAHRPARAQLLAAAGVLLVAVAMRTLDAPVCPHFPLGTHFLWHVLVATVIYLCLSVLIAQARGAREVPAQAARRAASSLSNS